MEELSQEQIDSLYKLYRAVCERLLTPNEQVHHINGIKTDNRPENLSPNFKDFHQWLVEKGYIDD